MNRRDIAILCLTLLASPWSLSAEPEGGVTLDRAVLAALAHEESVPLAEVRRDQAQARVGQAFSRFLPSLSFGAGYTRQDLAPTSDRVWYTRLTASQSVFEGGRDSSTLSSARSDRHYYESGVELARQKLFASVAGSFFGILSNESEVENLRRTISLAKERVQEIRSRARIGKSRDIELVAAQAQSEVLEAQLRAAEGELVTARQEFALMTGLAAEVPLVEGLEPPQPLPIESYLARIESRPDVQAAKAALERDESKVTVARSGHFPSVGLLGNYYFSRSPGSRGNDWDIGASLSFPIFSGGETAANVSEAASRARESALELSSVRRSAEVAIRTAYHRWFSAIEQIRALQAALRSTQQNYQDQARNYRFGQASNLDVIQALHSFQDTKRSLDRTRYSSRAAWSDLMAATAQAPIPSSASVSP